LEACGASHPALRELVAGLLERDDGLIAPVWLEEETLFLPRHSRLETASGLVVARFFEMDHPILFVSASEDGPLYACSDAVMYLMYGDRLSGAAGADAACDALARAQLAAGDEPLLARWLPEPLLQL
jgi:hypothetical protein